MAHNIGDVVGVLTRRGVVDAVVVSSKWGRAHVTYTLGPIPAPEKPVFMRDVKEVHLRPASGKGYSPEQIEAAQSQALATKDRRQENDYKRVEARLADLGETGWESGKGWTCEKLSVGDTVFFGTWSAKVVKLNLATGKVGIARPNQQGIREQRERSAQVRYMIEQAGIGGTRRGPSGPSLIRWVDPRSIVSVEKEVK